MKNFIDYNVLIDDFSSDNTLKLIKLYQNIDKRIMELLKVEILVFWHLKVNM